jgi:hypothetical protein
MHMFIYIYSRQHFQKQQTPELISKNCTPLDPAHFKFSVVVHLGERKNVDFIRCSSTAWELQCHGMIAAEYPGGEWGGGGCSKLHGNDARPGANTILIP